MEDSQAAAVALRRVVTRLGRRLREERPADGPGSAGLALLGHLYRQGELTAGELAAAERVQPQSLTRALAALEEGGLISRTQDSNDRRRQLIQLTAQGRETLTSQIRESDAWLAETLEQLNPTERGVLRLAVELLDGVLDGHLARD